MALSVSVVLVCVLWLMLGEVDVASGEGSCLPSHDTSGDGVEYVCNGLGLTQMPTNFEINTTNINLRNNSITEIPEAVLDLTALQHLDLSNNLIDILHPGNFRTLVNLRTLNLGGNKIDSVPVSAFEGLISLDYLWLKNNAITDIKAAEFNLPNLTSLDLRFCQISSIQPAAFNLLPKLELLNLIGNLITSLQIGMFATMTSIDFLTLGKNRITAIGAGLFNGMTRVKYIDLSENEITAIAIDSFQGLADLLAVELAANPITCTYADASLTCPTCENDPTFVVDCGEGIIVEEYYQCSTECVFGITESPPANIVPVWAFAVIVVVVIAAVALGAGLFVWKVKSRKYQAVNNPNATDTNSAADDETKVDYGDAASDDEDDDPWQQRENSSRIDGGLEFRQTSVSSANSVNHLKPQDELPP